MFINQFYIIFVLEYIQIPKGNMVFIEIIKRNLRCFLKYTKKYYCNSGMSAWMHVRMPL